MRLLILIASLYCLFLLSFHEILPSWDPRAQFSDIISAVNTAFAALAFAGILYAIHLQSQELKLQRKELRLTRNQLEKQTKMHEEGQEMAFAAQRPRLRFVRVTRREGKGPVDDNADALSVDYGIVTLELVNDGGPLYQAMAQIRYRYNSGALSELFPCDQDEDAYITLTSDPGSQIFDIPRGSKCYLHLHCRLHKGEDLSTTPIVFTADLSVAYTDTFNRLRESWYVITARHDEKVQFFLRDDYPPFKASWREFSQSAVTDKRVHAEPEDIYSELTWP